MNLLETYLNETQQRLLRDKFRVQQNAALPGNVTVELAASKLAFSWNGLLLISQHVFVKYVEDPTVRDAKQLFESGWQFAKKNNRVPLLRGMNFGYMIVPCIVTAQGVGGEAPSGPPIPEPTGSMNMNTPLSLLQYVNSPCPSHFSIIELPVLYDLSSQTAHYFKSSPIWGSWLYPVARKLVKRCLENSQ